MKMILLGMGVEAKDGGWKQSEECENKFITNVLTKHFYLVVLIARLSFTCSPVDIVLSNSDVIKFINASFASLLNFLNETRQSNPCRTVLPRRVAST